MAINLVFSRARYTGGPINLVFGAEAGPAVPDAFTVHGTIVLTDGLSLSGVAAYDNKNPRRASAVASVPHQVGLSARSAEPGNTWGLTRPGTSERAEGWQTAGTAQGETAAAWLYSQPRASQSASAWQTAGSAAAEREAVHQAASALLAGGVSAWQTAEGRAAKAEALHQVALALVRNGPAPWQVAQTLQAMATARHAWGRPVAHPLRAPWQQAQTPPPGREVWPPVDPNPFTPREINLNLVFACPAYAGGPVHLVFGRVCGNEPLPALIVIPIRSRYVTYNSILLRRVAGDIALNASSVDLSIDHKSWTWSWSAGLEKSALALLAPEVGEPVEMELSINGVPYRLYSEEPERQRKFPRTRVGAAGRGLACELDGDDVVQQYFSAATDRTAQQLANEALTVNGVGIGWDIDWQLTDWLVPGGVWSHMGTHISAVSAIAAAAGGYVQPHPTARTLRVLPGYPAAPWEWAGLTPDIELPAAPVTLENIRWHKRPAYNRVFISGEGRSTIWDVTRGGTAGLIEAPMVVDQLATHADASRQRGIAVLGDTGLQALVTLSLPVLQETGLILPGKLVRYVDGPTTRLGLVRSCAIEWRRPTLRQRINLETHI